MPGFWLYPSTVSTGGGGGGTNIIFKDEGVTLTSALASIDLVGKAQATAVGNDVTLYVPGAVVDIIGNRPAADDSNNGMYFWASDTEVSYISDGTTWTPITFTSATISNFVEAAQDAVGNILSDTATIDLTYNDAGADISAIVVAGSIGTTQLATIGSATGPLGSATRTPTVTIDTKGRVTALTDQAIALSATGDATGTLPGVLTLATVNANVGTFGSATQSVQFTVNAKGLITAAANVSIAITASQVTDFNEAAQDAVGNILTDTTSVDFTYNDGANTITADVPAEYVEDTVANVIKTTSTIQWDYTDATPDLSGRYIGDWKQSVKVATTTAGTLATSFENGDTIDGVALTTGDRILIKDQAAPAENGIYIVAASGAPARAGAADTAAKLLNNMVTVQQGTLNADTMWECTANGTIVVGTTALPYIMPNPIDIQTFTSSGTYTKPAGTQVVRVMVISSGCGGGSGRRGAGGSIRGGGGGGTGGGFSETIFKGTQVGATETVTIPAGGAGGTAPAGDSTNGNAGSSPTATSFGALLSLVSSFPTLSGGQPGTNAVGGAGGLAGIILGNWDVSIGGGAGSDGTTAAVAGSPGNNAGGGGGGGGGTSAANVSTGGASGGSGGAGVVVATGGASVAAAVAANPGNNSTVERGGGGGGGSGATAGGLQGGDAGTYGAGGGGSNGNNNGSAGARGGNGSAGIIIAVSYR